VCQLTDLQPLRAGRGAVGGLLAVVVVRQDLEPEHQQTDEDKEPDAEPDEAGEHLPDRTTTPYMYVPATEDR
jgi:hypothetical protein